MTIKLRKFRMFFKSTINYFGCQEQLFYYKQWNRNYFRRAVNNYKFHPSILQAKKKIKVCFHLNNVLSSILKKMLEILSPYYHWNVKIKLYILQKRETLPAPCISESYIKIKINLNFYFHTCLRCLKKVLQRVLRPL